MGARVELLERTPEAGRDVGRRLGRTGTGTGPDTHHRVGDVLFKHSWRSSGPGPAGGHSMPELSRMVDDDPPGWEQECRQIRRTLDEHGIALLDSRILGLPLNVRLQVETALGEPPYRVFDAWFHWTDQPHHFPA